MTIYGLGNELTRTVCTTSDELKAALAILNPKENKSWIHVTEHWQSGEAGSNLLAMHEALIIINQHPDLRMPSLAVKDVLEPSSRTRIDNYGETEDHPATLYLALLAFGCGQMPKLDDSVLKPQAHRSLPLIDFLMSKLSSKKNGPFFTAFDGEACVKDPNPVSNGTLPQLLSSYDHMTTLLAEQGAEGCISSAQSRIMKAAQPFWARCCFLLNQHALISVFHKSELDLLTESVVSAIDEGDEALERSKGPGFVLYKLLDSIVERLPLLLTYYRIGLAAFEERTFATQRPNLAHDMDQTKQLHLLHREIGLVKLFFSTTDRILDVLVSQSADEAFPLVSAEIADFLEETQDAVHARIEEMETLQNDAKDLMDLMFNLTGYRSTVSGSVLSGVAAIFLPLTWVCGVYGMNFAIIPELQWGAIVDPDTGAITGQPLGYMYFWVMSIVFAVISIVLLRFLRVF